MTDNKLIHDPIMPIAPKPSQYGIAPELVKKRVAEFPGMCSLRLPELFPELPPVIYPGGEDALDKLYETAKDEIRKVDMSKIKPTDSVNILASHHGFTLFGGQPYAILLKAIRDIVHEKTGTDNIRLRAGVGMRFSDHAVSSLGALRRSGPDAQDRAPAHEQPELQLCAYCP